MVDKPIIINGVNVSGCEHLGLYKEYKFKCGSCYPVNCSDNPNCYYKQLMRKWKECESLKKVNNEKNELLAKLGCPTTATAKRKEFTLQQQLDRLKTENDECIKDNEYLKTIIKDFTQEVIKLKTILTEIKEIALGVRNYLNYPSPRDVRYEMDIILQKISEVENG